MISHQSEYKNKCKHSRTTEYFTTRKKTEVFAVNYFFSLWPWCNYFGAAEMHPCSTVVSGRKWRRKLFPVEAAGPILIVIIWGWVSWLDVIISCQTKKWNFWKMKPVMIHSGETPVMGVMQKYWSPCCTGYHLVAFLVICSEGRNSSSRFINSMWISLPSTVRNAELLLLPFGCWCHMGWGKEWGGSDRHSSFKSPVCGGRNPTNERIACIKDPFKCTGLMG